MRKYGKLLIEGIENAGMFSVVTIPRKSLQTIVIEFSDPVTDGTGQTEPIPLRWANYLIVEADNWQEQHTEAIEIAIAEYNEKYPGYPIPEDEVMIWEI